MSHELPDNLHWHQQENIGMAIRPYALTPEQVDVLREVANIGTGNAVTSLAEMTGQPFNMSVPTVGVVEMERMAAVLGDPEALSAAVYMPVNGDVDGHVAFIFPFESACHLVDLLYGNEVGTTTELDELGCSAMMEVGNVIVSSFLNALADLTQMCLPASPPGLAVDMTAAILASIAGVSTSLGDHALTIMTQMTDMAFPLEGVFVFIPEPAALPMLFSSLGMAA
jgi:chemotaxis protein CheC